MIACRGCDAPNVYGDTACGVCGAALEPADDPRRAELLRRAREVCQLHWARQGHEDIDAKEYETRRDGHLLDFIRVSYVDDNFTEYALVGVHDGALDGEAVARFAALFADHRDVRSTPDLVYRGDPPTADVAAAADRHRIRLRSLDSYQRALWNHTRYLESQTDKLAKDLLYPLDNHVDKRWAPLGRPPGEADAAAQIGRWLATDGPRFVLVLGDFGTGKTFLIRVLARDLATHPDLVPVLVTMRDLEKRHTLDELIALHMARVRPEDAFHPPSFRHLLRAGRIVLLFDGFDELAQRPTYDRVKQHFETLRQAADGAAKIVVTSRYQHFATDSDVLNELGRNARGMRGARIIRLFPLDEHQRRDLVKQTIDSAEAAAFLRDLDAVPNLPELAANPRMLTFMMARRDSLARLAGSGSSTEPMTAGRLYEILLTDWLRHEQSRQTAPGAAEPLTIEQRCAALRQLAVLLWRSGRASVPLAELGELAEGIADLAAWQVQTGEAAHAVGSGTVLVRTEGDQFAFIHQSVLEWFVADAIRVAFAEPPGVAATMLGEHTLSPVMANFLCDLAGDRVVAWATTIADGPAERGPRTSANAILLIERMIALRSGLGGLAVTDLARQDLRGRDLSHTNLTGVDISDALLDGAVLPRALAGANLRGARLVGARLDKADLTGADLSGADLRGARLLGADLTGATLRGANLDQAVLLGAIVDPDVLATASTYGAAMPDSTPEPQHAGHSPASTLVALGAGDLLATGHRDGTVRIADTASGRMLRVLTGHTGEVYALTSRHGAWLASAGADRTVRIWDPTAGTLLFALPPHTSRVLALAASPDGRWLAVSDSDGTVGIWDIATRTKRHTLTGHSDWVRALAVDPAGAWLASASDDGTVRTWDPTTGTQLCTFTEHKSFVQALAASPDGRWLASAGYDRTIRLWNPITGEHQLTISEHVSRIPVLAAGPDGAWIASYNTDGTVRIWDLRQGDSPPAAVVLTGGVLALTTHPAGTWLATAGDDGTVRIWDPITGMRLRTFLEDSARVRALAVGPKGAWLASACDGAIQIWDPATGTHKDAISLDTSSVHALAAIPTGRWFASAGAAGTIRVWSAVTGHFRRTLTGHTDRIRALAVDPRGEWLASASDDKTVRIWNPTTGAERHTLTGHTDRIRTLAVDPRGEWLASASDDKTVRFWDPTTGKLLHTLNRNGEFTSTPAAHADGVWEALPNGDAVVWTCHFQSRWLRSFHQSPPLVLKGHTGMVRTLVTDPRRTWLATASDDQTVRIWDPSTGSCRSVCIGHAGPVHTLATDPDGTVLVSAGADRTVRLWDPAEGTLLATLAGDDGGSAIHRPDGSYRISGTPAGVWWVAGLCRFQPEEIDEIAEYATGLRREPT